MTKYFYLLSTLTVASTSLFAQQPDIGSQTNQMSQNEYNYEERAKEQEAADKQLKKRVRDYLNMGWFGNQYKNIDINTSKGIVTLSGEVDTSSQKQELERKVRNVPGVRAVRNMVSVKSWERH